MNERIKKTEEKLASLMVKQQSIIEKQDTELKKTAALEDLGNKLSSLEKQVQSEKKTIM